MGDHSAHVVDGARNARQKAIRETHQPVNVHLHCRQRDAQCVRLL